MAQCRCSMSKVSSVTGTKEQRDLGEGATIHACCMGWGPTTRQTLTLQEFVDALGGEGGLRANHRHLIIHGLKKWKVI